VLTPPGGHDIPAAINSPGHRQGHDLCAGLEARASRVLTCRRPHRHRVCRIADPTALIRRDIRRAGRRVQHGHRDRVALRQRDRGPAGGPLPELCRALAAATKAGHAYVVIDGTLVPIDRVAADRPFYSGKHRRHGMNLQVIVNPTGEIVWVSGPLPGAVHDLTSARIWGIVRELAAARPVVLADKGYIGAGDQVRTPLGTEQARLPERGQPRPRPATVSRRARPTLS
jgi:DDE superfamily endonuclease